MSGFDVQMRSQQMVNQSQQFYDAQRYQSMQQMGQSLMQAPGMIQDIMIRQQDAKMRLAQQQQEFQGNALKLQAMMAIDQADVSREQARSAKLQNDAMEQDMMLRRRQLDLQEQSSQREGAAAMLRAAGGLPGLQEAGIDYDFRTGAFSEMDEKRRLEVSTGSRQNQQRLEQAEERRRMEFEYKALMEQGSVDEANAILRQYRGETASPTPAPRSQPAAASAPMSPERMDRLTAKIDAALTTKGDILSGLNPAAAPHIASWMSQNSQMLLEQKKRIAKAKGWSQSAIDAITGEQAVNTFVTLLGQHGSQEQRAFIQFLNQAGAFDAMGGGQ
jgi:hypothetical protein